MSSPGIETIGLGEESIGRTPQRGPGQSETGQTIETPNDDDVKMDRATAGDGTLDLRLQPAERTVE